MKVQLLVTVLLVGGIAPLFAQPIERRCGWLENPSLGEWYLTDRLATWEIARPNGFNARGVENIRITSERDFVYTKRNYGYTCACMDVTTTRFDTTWRITSIRNFRQQSLKQCLEDPDLPRPL
ncbi:MAG: DUF4087 domain-containing protein [Pseudanabaenaceae cyanobacterium SKYGB_i_bin29]|nr:DUF4087 domain-containing protein [Pseudanabaenaceae cyanobacterium SKYG29]MDW8422582.1 DUF4087 domain-containing protein [Pseudanabaenaceae cyanobacterium SKYGB_i_bin29]